MPKVNEISVVYSTHGLGLGVDVRDVIEHLNNNENVKCIPDLFNNRFVVSTDGVVIEYIHNAVNEAVEYANKLKAKNDATPLDTSVSFRVDAPLEKIESFVEEIELDVEDIHAWNIGYMLTVSSDVFDEKHLIDCVGKYFDIV